MKYNYYQSGFGENLRDDNYISLQHTMPYVFYLFVYNLKYPGHVCPQLVCNIPA